MSAELGDPLINTANAYAGARSRFYFPQPFVGDSLPRVADFQVSMACVNI